jgi:hypothetical protein
MAVMIKGPDLRKLKNVQYEKPLPRNGCSRDSRVEKA